MVGTIKHISAALSHKTQEIIMTLVNTVEAKDLEIPKNIKLVYLPAYSPELNPVENLWNWLKRHSLHNRLYFNLKDVMDTAQKCLQSATPDFFKSLCGCNYISN
jgi:transposase